MRSRRAFAAILLAGGGWVVALGPAAAAQTGSTVHEAVVSTLAPNGDVLSTRVSQLIQLESRDGEEVELRVPRASDLISYRNLTGFTNPSGSSDEFVWRTSDKLDATALAKTTQELPISVRFTYFLDGEEVSPDEIKGKEGDVKIRVRIENVSGNPKTLEYPGVTSPVLTSTVNQYVPVEYLVRVEFPSNRWRGVGGEDVHVSPSGVEMAIASASGVIFPPATPTSVTVEFDAVSDDVLLPRIQVLANAHASQEYLDALQAQFEALQALYGGLGGLGETLGTIYDGTLALVDGVDDIIPALGERDERTGRPVVTLGPDGLPTTLIGTIGFLEQTIRNDVLTGIGRRDPKTGEGIVVKDEKGNATTLLGGLQSTKDTYDDRLIPAVNEAIKGLEEFEAQVAAGGGQLGDGTDQIRDGLLALLKGLQSGDPADPGIREGLEAVSAGLVALIASLDGTFKPGLESVAAGLATIIGLLDTVFKTGLTDISTGLGTISGGLGALIGSLQTDDLGDPGFREFLAIAQGIAAAGGANCGGDVACLTDFATIDAILTGLIASLGNVNDVVPDAATVIGALRLFKGGLDVEVIPGLTALIAGLGDDAPPSGVIGGLVALSSGVGLLLAGLGDAADPPTDTTVIGALLLLSGGTGLLLAGLGDADDPPTDTTIIGGVKLLEAGSALLGGGVDELTAGVLGGLAQIKAGFTNPEFTKSQASLDGKTPKQYFQECPACFDPASPAFDPFTAHPDFQPALKEVFELFSEGIESSLAKLHTFDAKNPGLVDGLEQIADGLDKIAKALHTFDPDDPGLVDGMNLVRSGLQQVSQGLFATNELGVRTTRGQVGDRGDMIGQWRSAIEQGGKDASSSGALVENADAVATTYVFELAAQSTSVRDNSVRGALMALTLAGLAVLWRRPRLIG